MSSARVIPLSPVKNNLPRRLTNAEVGSRQYLTSIAIDALMRSAKSTGRHRHRDGTLILIAHHHGLRLSELVALRWDQVDLKFGRIHVNRLKNGSSRCVIATESGGARIRNQ
jgi:type 1 fimbriae regulatory protein FimB/type 1 fimbriae regulatory protein FimE